MKKLNIKSYYLVLLKHLNILIDTLVFPKI